MRAVILAAGVGRRLGRAGGGIPKALLRAGDETLLARHVRILRMLGVQRIVLATGYRAAALEAELERLDAADTVRTVQNPSYREGSVVTLARVGAELAAGGPALLMDADVLYDGRLLARLLQSRHANCLLVDRNIEPGDDPVKVCVRAGRPVDLRKRLAPGLDCDHCGESVGFYRLSAAVARRLAGRAGEYVRGERRGAPYEEALRDLLVEDAELFGIEDVTGLPWIEIDFPADVERARREVLPRLVH